MAGHGRKGRGQVERMEQLKREFGLDKPLPVQYAIWLIGNDWMQVDLDGDGVMDLATKMFMIN